MLSNFVIISKYQQKDYELRSEELKKKKKTAKPWKLACLGQQNKSLPWQKECLKIVFFPIYLSANPPFVRLEIIIGSKGSSVPEIVIPRGPP